HAPERVDPVKDESARSLVYLRADIDPDPPARNAAMGNVCDTQVGPLDFVPCRNVLISPPEGDVDIVVAILNGGQSHRRFRRGRTTDEWLGRVRASPAVGAGGILRVYAADAAEWRGRSKNVYDLLIGIHRRQ